MKTINDLILPENTYPIRAVQFGEGNFLRAFVDDMLDIANEKGIFQGSVAIVKPIRFGTLDRFERQNNRYTVILRGMQDGKVQNESRVITVLDKVLGCYENTEEFFALAHLDTLRFVVSNTTEAGITLDVNDNFDGVPETYPGKLTKFLFERYKAFEGAADKGLIMLPVELIERNGAELRRCVFALCDAWKLPEGFRTWLENSCIFCSTLVDRIVTGYPKAEAQKLCENLGYQDELVDVGEPFALWVIEGPDCVRDELPLDSIGLPVIFTNDMTPYRERKVRVLNGAHTASVLIGYLCGLDIVRDCMKDDIMGRFVRRVVMDEIVPQVKLPREEVEAFAASVFERFENPFIDHALLSISLNSVSKWKARNLPSFRDSYAANGNTLPRLLTFSFAALLAFYTANDLREDGLHAHRANGDEYVIHDGADVLDFFSENSGKPTAEYVRLAASNTVFWGEDLTAYAGFVETVSMWLDAIRADTKAALLKVLEV